MSEESLIIHIEIIFESIPFITYVKMMPNLPTHTQHTFIIDSFRVVKLCSLRGEGRRGLERRVKNGVRIKHIITVD